MQGFEARGPAKSRMLLAINSGLREGGVAHG
jgi:hypothetical protein